ncbi:hypothetical protein [Limoniibacter endophyticus]|uniref:Uncharacterized protein n=1 Tax=Limoniibacter endophyticus TaxID=1565040 RepID=A0A8J3GFY5_9HYPH|nr:hypothetical protein [Limoniibacter endophyticus]GHC61707.1 hypothetical protein GCM10010136_02420 [Limoniibacter endophyticus]
MLSRIKGWLIAAGAALAIVASAFLYGRSSGQSATAIRRAEDRIKASNEARKIEDETSKLGGGDLDDALGRWMRDKR